MRLEHKFKFDIFVLNIIFVFVFQQHLLMYLFYFVQIPEAGNFRRMRMRDDNCANYPHDYRCTSDVNGG